MTHHITSWPILFGFLALGFAAGTLGGLIGIGGGVIITPLLVYLFSFSQHEAQGTTLALLLPPIGILAFLEYYKQGHVDLRVAALICMGFVLGGWLGAKLAIQLPRELLRKVFGGAMLLIAVDMLFRK